MEVHTDHGTLLIGFKYGWEEIALIPASFRDRQRGNQHSNHDAANGPSGTVSTAEGRRIDKRHARRVTTASITYFPTAECNESEAVPVTSVTVKQHVNDNDCKAVARKLALTKLLNDTIGAHDLPYQVRGTIYDLIGMTATYQLPKGTRRRIWQQYLQLIKVLPVQKITVIPADKRGLKIEDSIVHSEQ